MKRFCYLIAILLLPSLASASWFYVPNGGGYYYRTNGVTNDGWLYSKSYTCDSCGRRTYSWVKYQQLGGGHPVAAVQNYSGYASNEVQNSLVTLAKQKFEWQTIQQTINQLFPGAGGGQPYGAPTAGYAAPQVGNTQYGYSVQTVSATNTKPIDLEAQMERLSRMYAQAQDAARPIADGVMNATAQQVAGNNVALQTMAQAIRETAILDKLQPIQPQETKVQNTYSATASASSGGAAGGQAEANDSGANLPVGAVLDSWRPKFQAIITTKCATCHDAESPAGGVNLVGDVAALDKASLLAMLTAVTNPDETKRMPKDGGPLPDAELALFVKAWGAAK